MKQRRFWFKRTTERPNNEEILCDGFGTVKKKQLQMCVLCFLGREKSRKWEKEKKDTTYVQEMSSVQILNEEEKYYFAFRFRCEVILNKKPFEYY